jgi:ATP-dependent helicase HrpB
VSLRRTPLPVDKLLPEILAEFARGNRLVIEAPPGAGKTTRIPPALLSATSGDVLVLEPRRLAARMAARRVAFEFGETPGETVGYQVRFEDVSGPRTHLKFLTEGVLTRRFLNDPQLRGVGAVVLDEFHERHLDADLALALIHRLQRTPAEQGGRPDLKLIVMSATLNAAPIAAFLGDCPILRSEGKLFDLQVEYTPHSPDPLEQQVASAVERLLRQGMDGDVLVFLPGAAEIRRAVRALASLAARAKLLITPLHGDLSPAEQDLAVAPAFVNGQPQRKVILSTNVAESSVTIEGVTAVIDSGLARVAADSPWTGLPSLELKRISQASAIQRAGRAGRTAPGRVIRLYTAEDFVRRPVADAPEIARRELSQLVLHVRAMDLDGSSRGAAVEWLDPPPPAALDAANALLDRLEITHDLSRQMAELPLSPRLSKLILDARDKGVFDKACAVAAVLSTGERGSPDLLALAEGQWQPQTTRVYEQLKRSVSRRGGQPRLTHQQEDEAILQAVLAAFPDRVARRKKNGELLLSAGGSAQMADCRYEFLVAVDVEERRERGLPLVRLAAKIEPEWLLEHATERVSLEWNRAASRVEQVSALLYGQLVIEETRHPAQASEEAARILAQKALEVDIGRFADKDALEQLRARAGFAGIQIDVEQALTDLCRDCVSFEELAAMDLLNAVRPKNLEKLVPERLRLPGGREVKIHYDAGKPPWVESRLQDFFGMKETPRIGNTPVVVHLLAPNYRPVQVTTDLPGFWQRLYPEVRRELSRRYPKHKWPEKPE